MKNLSIICLLLFASVQGISQANFAKIDLYFLVDATDRELFAICKEDIKTNFGVFMKQTGFGDVKPGQTLTMHWGMIGGSGTLELESASITGPSKKQSLQVQRKLLNPAKLIQLRDSKLIEFEKKAESNLTNTSIIDVLLKAILEANTEGGECYFFVFSDLIENNEYINLYKKIPEKAEIPKVLKKCTDQYVIDKLQKKLAEIEPHIIFVQKVIPNAKSHVDTRKLRLFWQNLLLQLQISDVQFIDNLTNSFDI